MKKYIPILFLVSFIVPSVAFASWWNPFTWFKKQIVQQPVAHVVVSDPVVNETTHKQSIPISKKAAIAETKQCRPETFIPTKLSYKITDGSTKIYFENVITSNAPLIYLEAIRKVLLDYKDKTIGFSVSDPDPWLKDSNGNQIPYSPEQINSLNASSQALYDSTINYYSEWIQITDKIIKDKQDDGCIDAQTLSDYGPIPYFVNIQAPVITQPAIQPVTISVPTQPQGTNCTNYQTEKENMDEYYARNGTIFSSARSSEMTTLQAKYAGCF